MFPILYKLNSKYVTGSTQGRRTLNISQVLNKFTVNLSIYKGNMGQKYLDHSIYNATSFNKPKSASIAWNARIFNRSLAYFFVI